MASRWKDSKSRLDRFCAPTLAAASGDCLTYGSGLPGTVLRTLVGWVVLSSSSISLNRLAFPGLVEVVVVAFSVASPVGGAALLGTSAPGGIPKPEPTGGTGVDSRSLGLVVRSGLTIVSSCSTLTLVIKNFGLVL